MSERIVDQAGSGARRHSLHPDLEYSIELGLEERDRGRNHPLEPLDHRRPGDVSWLHARERDEALQPADPFAEDSRRIFLSRAFARLSGKTQFITPLRAEGVTSRLTHSLAVARISSLLAQRLGVDHALVTAIALGHDVGLPPFGHAGERAIRSVLAGDGNGDQGVAASWLQPTHHRWSVWILECKVSHNLGSHLYDRLNLTQAVRCGIDDPSIENRLPEAQIVGIVDSLAWINHDFRDLQQCHLKPTEDLTAHVRALGDGPQDRVRRVVRDLLAHSTPEQISITADTAAALDAARAAFARYCSHEPAVRATDDLAETLLITLLDFFLCAEQQSLAHSGLQPALYRSLAEAGQAERTNSAVALLLAMTDRRALEIYERAIRDRGRLRRRLLDESA